MFERIQRLASGRNVVIALAVFILALCAMNVAATLFYNTTGGYGLLDLGGGANLLDDRGSFTPAKAYMIISHYGQTGIHRYYGMLVADIFFPMTLGAFALLSLLWALKRIAPRRQWLYLLALVPPAYTLADWMENLGILTLLLNYPEQLPQVATLTNLLRGIKGMLASSSLVLVLVTGIFAMRSQQAN